MQKDYYKLYTYIYIYRERERYFANINKTEVLQQILILKLH